MNVLLIMSDEHRRDAMGCMRHSVVKTPHLDRLADEGCLFTAAYCSSPLCGPSRSSFVTGKYVHEIGCWDQNHHYAGQPESWGTHLISGHIGVTTIGKLDSLEGVKGGFPDHSAIEIDPANSNRILTSVRTTSNSNDIFLSTDGGATWGSSLTPEIGAANFPVSSVPWWPDTAFGSAIASVKFAPTATSPNRVWFCD